MLTIADYFLIPPDWSNEVSYSRTWKTTIKRVISGYEKRTVLFTWPRRTLSFDLVTLSSAEFALLKRKLFKNMHNIWGIPFWQDETTLSAQATLDQKVLNVVDTKYRNFEVGAPCIVMTDSTHYEVGQIASKTDTSITLVANLVATWASGASVYPIMQGRITSGQDLKMTTNTIAKMSIVAGEEFDSNITRTIGTASTYPTYKTRSVFDLEPEWRSGMKMSLGHENTLLQYLGKSYAYSAQETTDIRYSGTWSLFTKQEIQEFIDFFDSRRGRAFDFYFPSWQRDIEITAAFLDTATTLTVADIEYSTYWDNRKYNYICILFPDDTVIYRRILHFNSATEIHLDAATGKACTLANLPTLLVSFFHVGRFDMDELELSFLTTDVAEARSVTLATLAQTTTSSSTTSTTTTAPPAINTYLEDVEVYFPTTTTTTTTTTTAA